MKKSISLIISFVIFWFVLSVPLAGASNPFTTKQENQQTSSSSSSPAPALLGKIFVKIIVWQQYLKTKITSLVRQAETEGSMKPIFLLVFTAFAYGVIHAAGPGHGKAIALSYVLTQNPSYLKGLIFSNCIALFHGISGIVFVLFVKFIINMGIMESLDQFTNITQVVSYSIIAFLGAIIFLFNIYKLVKNKQVTEPGINKKINPVLAAAVIGCIPCPGVVIVMLFTLSMDLLVLSIVLGMAISVGMALTVSIIVLLAISGKFASLAVAEKHGKKTAKLEVVIELFAGMVLMTLGFLFLGANL